MDILYLGLVDWNKSHTLILEISKLPVWSLLCFYYLLKLKSKQTNATHDEKRSKATESNFTQNI